MIISHYQIQNLGYYHQFTSSIDIKKNIMLCKGMRYPIYDLEFRKAMVQ